MKKDKTIPPQLAQRFLLRFLRDDLAEEVLGDLEEKFQSTLKNESSWRAQLTYWYQVVNYLRPFAIQKSKGVYFNDTAMFRSYFKIGWRNLLKNKGYSFINIGGLAIGMSVAILNGLWIWDELSFNKYHDNYDRIAQVAEGGIHKGNRWAGTTLTYPLGVELITNHHDHFKHIVRTSWYQDYILSANENKISGTGLYADVAAPELFSFKMIYGSWSGLKDNYAIMISASAAKALFGTSDPLNKVIKINNKTDVYVTGVFEDFPRNSHFHGIKFFAPWSLWLMENKWIEERAINDWSNHFMKIYAEIIPEVTFESISQKIKDAGQYPAADYKDHDQKPEVFLYPMSQWHLYPLSYGGNGTDREPSRMVWLVGTIGGFVLLLACINFMNLSTARSEKRAKEVGIRKTIGSVRTQIIQQFFSESFIVVIFAFLMSIVITAIFLPAFNDIAAKEMVMPWENLQFWLMSILFIIVTSLLSGSYPALFLSSFKPVKVLKGTFRVGRFASMPRRVLVVIQFSISIVLIISTIVVYKQIQFAKNRPVGYSREGVIMIEKRSGDFYGKYDVLRNELKSTGAVEEVSEAMGKATEVQSGNDGWDWKNRDPEKKESFATLAITCNHGKTMGWKFIDGRDFSTEIPSDSNGIIINESAAKYMGLNHPVDEPVRWTWWRTQEVMNYKILGVIKDLVMASPYEPVEPTIFFLKGFNGEPNWIHIKINPNVSAAEALPKIEAVFKKIIPTAPFDYKFVDEEYALKFAAEERVGKLALIFGVLAIFISCLGLFGLASFVAEQRTKEIGIRKVVGASVFNLWQMLSKEFIALVIISCILAFPIGFYLLNGWLQKYAYRTDISIWIFVLTATAAFTITLVTVSYQAINAALMNPVKSLRSE